MKTRKAWGELMRSLAALSVAIGIAATARGDTPPGSRSCGPGCLEWQILSPPTSLKGIVKREYREIAFDASDVVEVKAGGCGHEETRKDLTFQYLNPTGDRNSPGAFIYIPGVTSGFTPLNYIVGQKWAVPASMALSSRSLWLGFAPGQDGKPPQGCSLKRDGEAYVTVSIWKGQTADERSRDLPYRPLDLTWSRLDANGLPLNPRWSGQKALPGGGWAPCVYEKCSPGVDKSVVSPGGPCTRQRPYWDFAWKSTFVCRLRAIEQNLGPDGHVNWGPATFEGQIKFGSFDTGDRDYNFELSPSHGEALFPGRQTLHLEFNNDDVHALVPFWQELEKRVVTGHDDRSGQRFVRQKRAVVTGLLGLDCRHLEAKTHCLVEIHPVYGLAIEEEGPDPKSMTSKWAVVARNWGGEGECSRSMHLLYTNRLAFRLPGLPGAGSPVFPNATPTQQTDRSFLERKYIRSTPGGAVVVYELPSPEAQGGRRYVQDELVIQWNGKSAERFDSVRLEPPLLRTAKDRSGRRRALCDDPEKAKQAKDKCQSVPAP